MSSNIIQMLFFGLPMALTLFFVICLIRYIIAKKRSKKDPEKYDGQVIRDRKTLVIVSAVLWGTDIFVSIALIALVFVALMNM